MLARLTSVSIALLLSACGLRGPLYLPGDKEQAAAESPVSSGGAVKSQGRPAPAPQSQKRDRDEQENDEEDAESASPPDPDGPATVPAVPPGN